MCLCVAFLPSAVSAPAAVASPATAAGHAGRSAGPATSGTPESSDSCGASSLVDNFATDTSLDTKCWATETALVHAVESVRKLTDVAPVLTFGGGSMLFHSLSHGHSYSAVQSTRAYSAPVELDASVAGVRGAGNVFAIYLSNASTSQTLAIQGNLDPVDAPHYGMWGNNKIPANRNGFGLLSPNDPAFGTTYSISMAIDAAGNGYISVNGSSPVTIGQVGTGPFYVLLGQRSGDHFAGPTEEARWFSVAVSTGNGSVSTSLSTGSPTVDALESVPASAVPASSIDGSAGSSSADPSSIPLHAIPLHAIGLSASPVSSIPLHAIPLHAIATPAAGTTAVAAAQQALSSVLLSDLSVEYPSGCESTDPSSCTGWSGVLAGTQYANAPLEAVTLEDVLADPTAGPRFDSVDLADLDITSSSLGSLPLSSIALGDTTLSSIPLPGTGADGVLAEWCSELSSLGYDCSSDFGIDPSSTQPDDNGVTLLTLALAGVPLGSISLSPIPLHAIPLTSSPLGTVPLHAINLSGNPISEIPLDDVPLDSIPLGGLELGPSVLDVVCQSNASFTCSAGDTLSEVADAGALVPGATVGDLDIGAYCSANPSAGACATTVSQLLDGDTTTDPAYPAVTLGDLLLTAIPPASYPWQSVQLSSLPLAASANAAPAQTVTYDASLAVSGVTSAIQVALTLPKTFAYVPGSSTLDGSPVPDPAPGNPLTWSLVLAAGTHTLSVQARSGIGLGSASATLSAIDASTPNSSSAAVQVVDGEEPDGTAATATTLHPGTSPETGNLNLGYLTTPGDLNDWSVSVPAGDELALALTNLPATYDLELFGPRAAELQGNPAQQLPGVDDTLPSLTPASTTEATPGSDDLPVQPPAGYQLESLSNNSHGKSQYIQTPPLAGGTYYVQVSGYNGAFSDQPYLLQANLLGGATTPSCPAIYDWSSLPPPASGPPSIPAGVNTLFLVNTQLESAAFGSDAATVMSDLQAVATDSSAGVKGAIIPVDSYSGVESAYESWDSNPCSVDAANDVVSAIAAVADGLRAQYPTIQNLVIVGPDDQIPFARIADGATQSNERDYGAASFPGENNVEADALSLGYYLSDDPYAGDTPLGVGSATLYLPQVAVGRLVESASQIEEALTRFKNSDGNLDATSSLTTGYSFLSSGAQAISANLGQDGMTACSLINASWTESELDSDLASSPCSSGVPGVVSLNAHFDYSRAQPSENNTTNNDSTDLFTTTDIRSPSPPTSFAGRLLFSMGCHSGLDVDDAEVAASGVATPVDDWAKAFADAGALWVANTGYGYADTGSIAYSAKLMGNFASSLGSLSIGEALTEAKQQYAAGDAVLGPYDLKALMESTLYGLPMYRLNQPSGPSTPPSGPPTSKDPATGLPSSTVSLSTPIGSGAGQLGKVSTAGGDYYELNGASTGAGVQTTEYRPIEPLATAPVSEPGLLAHGALLTGLASEDFHGFSPAYSMPAVGAADSAPPDIGYAAFPGTLQRVATYGTFTSAGTSQADQLDLVAGQFFPNPSAGDGSGTQRLFTSMTAQVFYDSPTSRYASDYQPPTVASSSASSAGGSINFDVQVAPGPAPVEEVVILYTDASAPGAWSEAVLSSTDGVNWTGSVGATPSGQAQYLVEAVDAAGNVGFSDDEAADFNSVSGPPISIQLSGAGPVGGYFTGPVTATISAPSGSTYVLDGSPAAPIPQSGSVVVNAAGDHTITVTDPSGDSDTQAFAISYVQSVTSISLSSNLVLTGQGVTLSATVSAASGGAGTPTGSVEFLDGDVPVAACGGASGEPLVNGSTSPCSVSYSTPGVHPFTASYLGDGTFSPSVAGVAYLSVEPAGTTTSLSLSASSATYGNEQSVVFTAGVAASPGFTPAGTITVQSGSSTLCTITLPATTCSPSATALGASPSPYTLTAAYSGGSGLEGSTSAGQAFTVYQATSSLTLTSSANPSIVGSAVTYTATLSPGGGSTGTPTGSVEFVDGSTPIASCGGAAGVPLTGKLQATCTVTYTSTGAHPIMATYLGDSNFAGATAPLLTQNVTYGIDVVLSPPPGYKHAVLFTVQLQNSSGANVTTASITVTAASVDGTIVPVPVAPDPGNLFLFVPIVDTDVYALSTAALSPGSHTLTIGVSGDPLTHNIPFTVKGAT